MKLLTNVAPLLPPLTGIGHYTHQLLQHMLESGQLSDVKGVSAMGWHDKDAIERLLVTSTETTVPTGPSTTTQHVARAKLINIARKVPFARRCKRLLENRAARRMVEKCSDYIYWEPNYTLLPLDNPSAVTVYDLSHIHFPQYHPAERISILEDALEKSIKKASRVITISEYTRKDIVDQFNISPDRIDVVSPAVCDSFRLNHTTEELNQVRKQYQLPENYILSVATLEPRKNIEGLIRAYTSLPDKLRKQFPLILVGTRGWLNDELDHLLTPLLKKGEAFRLGYVAQAHLPLIYSAATCMAYVSFFEGYGMPVAEAMAAGVPVITSNTSSMPEVAAGGALLVDPYDVDSITAALRRLLEDQALRASLSTQGRSLSATYTWQRSSKRLLSVLKQVQVD